MTRGSLTHQPVFQAGAIHGQHCDRSNPANDFRCGRRNGVARATMILSFNTAFSFPIAERGRYFRLIAYFQASDRMRTIKAPLNLQQVSSNVGDSPELRHPLSVEKLFVGAVLCVGVFRMTVG